jgi:hypothetical protein
VSINRFRPPGIGRVEPSAPWPRGAAEEALMDYDQLLLEDFHAAGIWLPGESRVPPKPAPPPLVMLGHTNSMGPW